MTDISPIQENQANFDQHASFLLEKLPPPQISYPLNTGAAFFMVNGLFVRIPSSVQRFQETSAVPERAVLSWRGWGPLQTLFY